MHIAMTRRHDLDAFLDRIEHGDTIRQAAEHADTNWRTVSLRIASDADFAARYARARLHSAQFYADKAQEAVEQAVTGEDATIARVKADVYKWRARVANPKDYGDKSSVEVSGTVGHLHLAALQATKLTAHASIDAPKQLASPADMQDSNAEHVESVLIQGHEVPENTGKHP